MTDLLDDFPDIDLSPTLDSSADSQMEETSPVVYLEEGEIDPRIKLLSHSSRSTLNKCPRKFQLYRLSAMSNEGDPIENLNQQITFDYGTCVGIGIQGILQHLPMDKIVMEMFLAWSVDLMDRNPRHKKSFWEALLAVTQFETIAHSGYLEEYELLYYTGEDGSKKPAVEMSFKIDLPGGYSYRGYIDGVLRHKLTGAVVVLEDKTTSFRQVNSAMYKNSGQALGYSVILDKLFPGLSAYTVLYLVYSSTSREYTELPFEKSAHQRALWLTELLIDTRKIDLYEDFGVYPMNGDFCFDFFKECEYLGLCQMSTPRLTKELTEKMLQEIKEKEESYDFTFDFHELIQSQQEKV